MLISNCFIVKLPPRCLTGICALFISIAGLFVPM